MSFRQYCYEIKSIQALSWANFAIRVYNLPSRPTLSLTIPFHLLVVLTLSVLAYLISSVAARGYGTAWGAPVSDLPWFGEMQWGRSYAAGYPQGYYPQVRVLSNHYHHFVINTRFLGATSRKCPCRSTWFNLHRSCKRVRTRGSWRGDDPTTRSCKQIQLEKQWQVLKRVPI